MSELMGPKPGAKSGPKPTHKSVPKPAPKSVAKLAVTAPTSGTTPTGMAPKQAAESRTTTPAEPVPPVQALRPDAPAHSVAHARPPRPVDRKSVV